MKLSDLKKLVDAATVKAEKHKLHFRNLTYMVFTPPVIR